MNEKILWNDGRASLDSLYSWSRAHKTYKNIQYGRRRSGKRWFWAATQILNPETEKFGWADTEHQALGWPDFVSRRRNSVASLADPLVMRHLSALEGLGAKPT